MKERGGSLLSSLGSHMRLFLQGFPMMTLANFEEVLSMISCLAMKGSLFVGELPAWLSEAELETKVSLLLIIK